MATIYRFPICIWRTSADSEAVTVRLADDGYEEALVTANSVKDAVSQIRDYLHFISRDRSWAFYEPDFMEPEMRVLKFSVLPEYREKNRTFPCRESIRFRLPCLTGKREAGSPIAFFPTLGVFFDYHREDGFQQLATHIAQRHLAGMTPRQLSRYLPPDEIGLDTINITIKESVEGRESWEREFRPLTEVADHLGQREFRMASRTWEREKEVTELVRLLRDERASVCLVGESGCGKTAVLTEAARRIERERSGAGGGKQRIFWLTSGARLIAGMRWLGQWQERLEEVIRQTARIPGVLCLENLAELTRLGGSTPEASLAAFLTPFLENGELRIVAEATPGEFDACDRILPGLIDRLQILKLEPFDPGQSRRIVQRAAEFHTQNDGVTFGPAAADRTHDLFARFQPYVAFPGKVIQFMGSVVDRTADLPRAEREIQPAAIDHAFAEHSGLPAFLVREDESFNFDAVVSGFKEKLIAQDEAVESVCRLVAKFAAGLNDPGRPIGVLLFCGPTGVGKTQLVRLLGDFLFPNRPEKERIHRLDMSEYAGYDAAERLLGPAQGEPSTLIRSIRAHPFGVLLLDEIEKAGDEVFDIFLNVFEEGRLTDSLGRVTAFNSTLIVMTSNLGAGGSGTVGFRKDGSEAAAAEVDRSAVLQFFRPEFFNRLDQLVTFHPLGREAIEAITRKELEEIETREGLADRELTLRYDEALVAALAERGFDPVYGARPLQRKIEELVTLPLSRWLAESSQQGMSGESIGLDWNGDAVSFRRGDS